MSTRELVEKSFRAALAASEVTGAITMNAASLAGFFLFCGVPPLGTGRVFDAAHEYIALILAEERGATDTQRQTG